MWRCHPDYGIDVSHSRITIGAMYSLAGTAGTIICGTLVALSAMEPTGRVVFTMLEHVTSWAGAEYRSSYSELRFLDNGEGEERTWTPGRYTGMLDAEYYRPPSWSTIRKFRLAPKDYQRFRRFLDTNAVKNIGPSNMNAGPGVGDYRIEIQRAAQVQGISVGALLPSHVEYRKDPTLLQLVCGAKKIAGLTLPAWCSKVSTEQQ